MKRLAIVAILAVGWKADEPKYIGAGRACMTCHDKDSLGKPGAKWKESRHAKAFETLSSEGAKKIAKDRGIEDPAKSEACTKCHLTESGIARERLHEKFEGNKGVQCESCHGPAGAHQKARNNDGRTDDDAIRVDALKEMPLPTLDGCAKCHNADSPSIEKSAYWDKDKKTFDAKKAWEEIRHPNPLWKKEK